MANRQEARLSIPTLAANQHLKDLIPHDPSFKVAGKGSRLGVEEDGMQVNLEPGAIHAFLLDTPNLEMQLPTLYNTPDERPVPSSPTDRRDLYEDLRALNYAEAQA